jgi:hypothetical protein
LTLSERYPILIFIGVVPARNPLPANESSGTTGTLNSLDFEKRRNEI